MKNELPSKLVNFQHLPFYIILIFIFFFRGDMQFFKNLTTNVKQEGNVRYVHKYCHREI